MIGLPSRLQFPTKEKAYEYMETQNLRHVVSLAPITKTVKKFLSQVKNPACLVPGRKNPVRVRKLPGGGYRVTHDGKVSAARTTKKRATAQARLLRGVKHGMIPRKNPAVHRPAKPMEIYGRLLRIEAQKGPGHVCDAQCKKANHCYYHDFSRHARVFGMPDGSLRITDKT